MCNPVVRKTAARAIVEALSGKTSLRLLGPRETVAAQARSFDELLRRMVVDEDA